MGLRVFWSGWEQAHALGALECQTLKRTKMRVLIVENDALIGLSIQDVLESAGHDVVCCANDLASAQGFISAEPPFDLVLVDFQLDHGCSGVDIARLFIPLGIAVMFVSSNPDGCRTAINSGALGCLRKPFTETSLVATVSLVEKIVKGETPAKLPSGLELYGGST
jgi:two-component system, response regulator PdtaR